MSSKPLIGMNADYRSARKDSPAFSYLCAGYYDAIVKVDAIPLVVPPLEDMNDLDRVLDLLDGMILIGGADLDPRYDGFMLHPSVRPMDRRREEFDRKLIQRILPVVCQFLVSAPACNCSTYPKAAISVCTSLRIFPAPCRIAIPLILRIGMPWRLCRDR